MALAPVLRYSPERGMRRSWVLVLAVAVGGCDGCDRRKDGPPPTRAADAIDAPDPALADAMWKRASEGLAVADASPGTIAYQAPSCALRYALRDLHVVEIAPGTDPAEVEARAAIAMNPSEGGVTLQLLSAKRAMTNDGQRGETAMDPAGFGPTSLKSDGRRWLEVHGPTTLWSSHTALPPLSAFFPILPLERDVGAKAKWAIASYKQSVTSEAERLRQQDAAVPAVPPDQVTADLMLARWQTLSRDARDDRVAVIEAAWKVETEALDPIETRRMEKWFGRFVVSERGRLIHAAMVATTWHWWLQADERSGEKRGTAERELRLVEACDGVVLDPG